MFRVARNGIPRQAGHTHCGAEGMSDAVRGSTTGEDRMRDGQGAEPPQGTPSTRALGAMESAVRRAREAAGGAPPPPPPPQRLPPESPARVPSPTPSLGSARQTDRWLIGAVVVVAVLLVVAAIGLAVSLANGNGSPRATTSSVVTTPSHAGGSHQAHHPSTSGGGSPSATSPSSNGSTNDTTTSTTPPGVPGGAPVISALNPSSGPAGESVQVAGSNFLSTNGRIVATFDGQVASTSCPAQNTCTVTVPAATGSPSAQVTITTSSGTSNAVTFTYS